MAGEKGTLMKEQHCIKKLFETGEFDDEELEDGQENEEQDHGKKKKGLGEIQKEDDDGNVTEQADQNCQKVWAPPPQDKRKRSMGTLTKIKDLKAKLIKLKLRARQDKTNDGVLGVQAEDSSEEDSEEDEQGSFPTLTRQGSSFIKDISSSISGSRRQRSSIFVNFSKPPPPPPSAKALLPKPYRRCSRRSVNYPGSVVDEEFVKYNMNMKNHQMLEGVKEEGEEKGDETEMDVEYCEYVRKPDLGKIIEQYDAMANHPKYS